MQLTAIVANTLKQASFAMMQYLKTVNNRDLDTTHYLIVPDRASFATERELVSLCGEGSLNIQVLTLRRFANKLFSSQNYLSKQGALIILHRLIKENFHRLKCLNASSAGKLAESVYEVICSFKYNRIKPREITTENLSGGLKNKLSDIMLLYEKYQEHISGTPDSADKMELLIDVIDGNIVVKNACFHFKDFDNYSAQEIAVLRKLVKNSKGVFVATAMKSQSGEKRLLYSNDIFKILQQVAQGQDITLNVIPSQCQLKPFAQHICDYMFSDDGAKLFFEEVKVSACRNVDEEVTALAAAVAKHVRCGGRYSDFTVIATDTNVYENSIQDIFSCAEIPFHIDGQKSLASHPLPQQIFNFLALAADGFGIKDVLNYTKNFFFHKEETIDDIHAFEKYCNKYNPDRRFLKPFVLGNQEPFFFAAEKVRKRFSQSLDCGLPPQKALGQEFISAVKNFLFHTQAERNLELLKQRQVSEDDGINASFTAQVWQKLSDALDEFSCLTGQDEWELEDFSQALHRVLLSINLSTLPPKADAVNISNMGKARNHCLKHLWVLGAVDKMFPIVKTDTKLINDSNIRKLAEKGINLTPNIRLENFREKFSVFNLLCEPAESLTVTYNLVTQQGKATSPSETVRELERLFGTTVLDINIPATKSIAQRKVVSCLRDFKIGVRSNLLSICADYYALNLPLERMIPVAYPVRILEECNLLPSGSVGITAIENYYACPHSSFLSSSLKLEKPQKFELEASLLGNLLHNVLEHFVKNLKESMTEEDLVFCINSSVDKALDNDFVKAVKERGSFSFAIERLRNESMSVCRFVFEAVKNSMFKPFVCEYRFGDKKELTVTVSGKKVELKGRIDRIDVCGDRFIVLDYKSGSKVSLTASEIYMGRKLQLLSYLVAASNALGKKPAGCYYLQLQDNYDDGKPLSYCGKTISDKHVIGQIDTAFSMEGFSKTLNIKTKKDGNLAAGSGHLTEASLAACMDYAKIMAANAVERLMLGDISVLPVKGKCDFCDFFDICDFNDTVLTPERECGVKVDEEKILQIVKNQEGGSGNGK